MLGIIGKIMGSDSVISQGIKLIDDMHTSDEEAIAARSKARTELMAAYAPFKIAQRFLALMFGFTFLASYIIVLTMTILGKGDPNAVTQVMEQFSINWAMMIILGFYFGAGAMESFQNKKKSS